MEVVVGIGSMLVYLLLCDVYVWVSVFPAMSDDLVVAMLPPDGYAFVEVPVSSGVFSTCYSVCAFGFDV